MPNNDYILRSDALFELHRFASAKDPALMIAYRVDLCERIEKIPAADVEPKRGTGWWIPGDYVAIEHGECVTYPGEGITCSYCHYGFKSRFLWSRNYCPHCGSWMLPEPPKEGKEPDNGV